MLKILRTPAAILGTLLLTGGVSSAAPISFAGDLTSGQLFSSGFVTGRDRIAPSTWDDGNLWTLAVTAGDEVTVTARRTSDVDPVLSLWDGTEVDSTAYRGFRSDSTNTSLIGEADDELSANVGGFAGWGDPQLTFTASKTGVYTVGIFAYSGRSNRDYSYTIQATGATRPESQVSAVPLPATLPLMLVALAGFGLAARQRA
ncbi:MAG: PEP-CTERM sorting domain-containing protein [Litoreibacter sp.]